MTIRDAQIKAYKDYQDALKEAEKKKPDGLWATIYSDSGGGQGRLIYDPAGDMVELSLAENGEFKIPGKYLVSIYEALGKFLEEAKP